MAVQGFVLGFLAVAVQAAAASVEPPTDVKVTCQNFQNIVLWNYSQQDVPELKFKVHIRSLQRHPQEIPVYPPNLSADISSNSSDLSDDYYVYVTAVVGENESKESNGVMFSYFSHSLADHKCTLDFPQVNITAQDDGHVRIHFPHPWVLYHLNRPEAKSRKRKSNSPQTHRHLPELKYDVTVLEEEFHKALRCNRSVCEEELNVGPRPDKYCLKFVGEMKDISVTETEHCTKPVPAPVPTSHKMIFIVAGIVLGVAAFVFIFFMVYRKKTMPSTSLPSSMIFPGQRPTGQVYHPYMGPCSPVPLLSTPGEEDNPAEKPITPDISRTSELDLRLPIGVDQVKAVSEEEEQEEDEEVRNDADYQSGRALDDEEPSSYEHSGYETREKVVVELEPGEDVEGYRS